MREKDYSGAWNTVFGGGVHYPTQALPGVRLGVNSSVNDSFVGNMVENALYPPNMATILKGSGAGLSGAPIGEGGIHTGILGYNVDYDSSRFFTSEGLENSTRMFAPVRSIYGRFRVYPDIASNPYTLELGGQRQLFVLYDLGYGHVELEDMRIGTTPLSKFKNIDWWLWTNYTDQRPNYFKNSKTTSIIDKEVSDNYVTQVVPGAKSDGIFLRVHFPKGLIQYRDDGSGAPHSAQFLIEFRNKGGSWRTLKDASDIVTNRQVQTINGDILNLTDNTTSPFTLYVQFTVPFIDNLEVRVRRVPVTLTGDRAQEESRLIEVGNIFYRQPLLFNTPHTVFELRYKGGSDVSDNLNEFNVLANRHIPVWDGAKWETKFTRNPAWVALDILMGAANPKPIPEYRIDLKKFAGWAAFCDIKDADGDPMFTLDANMDSDGTVHERLLSVMQSARASITMRNGLYSVIWEHWPNAPIQVFTPANSWGFTGERVWTRDVDGLVVEYIDPNLDYQQSEVVVYTDGKDATTAQHFESIATPYCTNYKQAWRDGRYHLAVGKLRPEQFVITTDVESLLCERGDRVRVQQDVPRVGGVASRIENVAGFDITMREPVVYNASKNYEMVIRYGNGGSDVFKVTGQKDPYTLTVQTNYQKSGANILQTPDLSSATGWLTEPGAPWTFGPNGASMDGTQIRDHRLYQQWSKSFQMYYYEVEVTAIKAGTISFFCGDITDRLNPITAPGTYKIELQKQSGGDFGLHVTDDFNGTIKRFSIIGGKRPQLSVKVGDLGVYGEKDIATNDFLVRSITPGDELTATITLLPLSPAIKDADKKPIPPYAPPIGQDEWIPDCLRNVKINGFVNHLNRMPYGMVEIWWEAEGHAAFYQVWHAENPDGPWTFVDRARTNEFLIWDHRNILSPSYPQTKQYIKVIPVSMTGHKPGLENCPYYEFLPPLDTTPPGKPLFFNGNVAGTTISLNWLPPDDLDVAGYIIKFSPDLKNPRWDNATIERELLPHDTFSVDLNVRIGSYLIKTIDTSGNYSVKAAVVRTTIPELDGMNVIKTIKEHPAFSGQMMQVVKEGQHIRLDKAGSGHCGAFEWGTYNFENRNVLDLGDIMEPYLRAEIEAFGDTCIVVASWLPTVSTVDPVGVGGGEDWNVMIQVRTATTLSFNMIDWVPHLIDIDPIMQHLDSDFTAWQRLTAGFYTGRYFQFRAFMTSKDGNSWPVVDGLTIHVDMPDRTDQGHDIAVASGGSRILFPHGAFMEPPALATTQDDGLADDTLVISHIRKDGFDAEVFAGDGTSKAGQIDYMAKGYGKILSGMSPGVLYTESDNDNKLPGALLRTTKAQTIL